MEFHEVVHIRESSCVLYQLFFEYSLIPNPSLNKIKNKNMLNQQLFWVFLKNNDHHVCLRYRFEDLHEIIENLGGIENVEYKKIKKTDAKKMNFKINSTYIDFDNCKDPQNIIELKIK